MSDTSILPGAALPASESAPPPPPPDLGEEGGGDDRRRLLIVGGVLLVVIVAVLGYLLLHGGKSASNTSSGLVPRLVPPSSAPTHASGSANGAGGAHSGSTGAHAGAGAVLPPKSHTRLARDPFKPLISDRAPASGTVTGSTTTVTPAQSSAPGTVPTSPSQGAGPPQSLGPPHEVRLVRVQGDKSAVFDVTYAHHKVFRYDVVAPSAASANGTVFAQDFALLGIQGSEVTLQIGDDTPFDLRVGASHTA